ncbi:MAG: hypothetical protein WCF44_09590 [Candidatus Methylophosphatis roskildensis]
MAIVDRRFFFIYEDGDELYPQLYASAEDDTHASDGVTRKRWGHAQAMGSCASDGVRSCKTTSFAMKAIAEYFGVHYATVSRAVKDRERRDAG